MWKERLGGWYRGERRKLEGMAARARAEYIWQYYKLWIIAALSLVFLTVYVAVIRLTVPQDNWFYLTLANTYADVGQGSDLWQGFVDYGGYDTREKNVFFNGDCYFDPADTGYNAYFTYFVAYVEAGTLDAITMERDDLALLGGRGGRLLDLRRPEAGGLAEKYADRLIYAVPNHPENAVLDSSAPNSSVPDTPAPDDTVSNHPANPAPDNPENGGGGSPEDSADPVPIGIDLSDTALVSRWHIYTDTCALGVSANCPHPDAVAAFLDYVFSLEGGTA